MRYFHGGSRWWSLAIESRIMWCAFFSRQSRYSNATHALMNAGQSFWITKVYQSPDFSIIFNIFPCVTRSLTVIAKVWQNIRWWYELFPICYYLDTLKWCIWYFISRKSLAPPALAFNYLCMCHFLLSVTLPFFHPGSAPGVAIMPLIIAQSIVPMYAFPIPDNYVSRNRLLFRCQNHPHSFTNLTMFTKPIKRAIG